MHAFTREDRVVGQLVSGHELTIPIFRFGGRGRGPKVYVQASIHGAELQGNAVIYQLIRMLQQDYEALGEITLIPMANPMGMNQKFGDYTYGRFDPMTGENWNRAYWNITCRTEAERTDPSQVAIDRFLGDHPRGDADRFREALRAAIRHRIATSAGKRDHRCDLALLHQSLAIEADIVLDLHTAAHATRYLYVPEYAADEAPLLDIPFHLLVPNIPSGALDEAICVPWRLLHEALDDGRRPPVTAFTVELGGKERIDLEEAEQDARGLINYLLAKGAVAGPPIARRTEQFYRCAIADYHPIHAPRGGLIDFAVEPGVRFAKGQALGTMLSFEGLTEGRDAERALTILEAPFDGIPLTRLSASSVHQGTELMTVMTEITRFRADSD